MNTSLTTIARATLPVWVAQFALLTLKITAFLPWSWLLVFMPTGVFIIHFLMMLIGELAYRNLRARTKKLKSNFEAFKADSDAIEAHIQYQVNKRLEEIKNDSLDQFIDTLAQKLKQEGVSLPKE